MNLQRRTIGAALALAGLLAALALALLIQRRQAACAYVPLLGDELLPNAALAPDPADDRRAQGWASRTASGVELQRPGRDGRGFDLDGDDRAVQLIGIANYLEAPAAPVRPGASYCFSGFALTDQPDKGDTRAQLLFRWLDANGQQIGVSEGEWQPVALWQPGAAGWSPLRAAFRAPEGAAQLRVRVRPAADNRLYLDAMHLRRGGVPAASPAAAPASAVRVLPWPRGYAAALSFSFDWETTMGGLIHSRSLAADDPNNALDPRMRGLRMRQGITTTLELFREYDIRATYYATGYNFLSGNAERRTFMGDPTFGWATEANGWRGDWSGLPWFATDPHGRLPGDPDYYFGDLVALLRAAGQDIQTHTFSHLYGGYASPAEWRADLAAWSAAAGAAGVPPARSLAFPWSGSGGMSDASWRELEAAGITSVTRTNRSQSQYQLAQPDDPHCAPVPGHERILACPDFYLTTASAGRAAELLRATVAAGGMLDLWAHTEEVTSPEQVAAWRELVALAAAERDAGRLWVAPLAEIADWQQSLAQLTIENQEPKTENQGVNSQLSITMINQSKQTLEGVVLTLPFEPVKTLVDGHTTGSWFSVLGSTLTITLQAGQTVEVQAWPA